MKRRQAGFSLLEVLLSVAILTLTVTALSGILIYGRQSSAVAADRERALLIAREAQEAVRTIRNNDFSALSSLADGVYGLALSGNVWTLCTCTDSVGQFSRQVELTSVDATTQRVDVTVSWQQTPTRTGTVETSFELTDWQRSVENDGNVFRVTEYTISSGFTGASYSLVLNQDLASNYFVIVQGADGSDSGGGNYGPAHVYAAVTGDPFGTGDFSTTPSNRLRIERGAASGSAVGWRGVVTVIECLADCAANGFELIDAKRISHSGTSTSGVSVTSPWTNASRVMVMGGVNGSGCSTSETSTGRYPTCHVLYRTTGLNTINWERSPSTADLSNATSTAMVVQWGSEWGVQRVDVSGNSGGNGADNASEYDTAVINPVARDNTWVWGSGYTDDDGIGDGAEGSLITLGDGEASQNESESLISVGQEYTDQKNYSVYALTHGSLAVDYRFKSDGNSGDLIYTATVDTAEDATSRMALVSNGQNGTGTAYPRPIFAARYSSSNQVELSRRRSGQNWPAWVQGIDFSAIQVSEADTTPPSTISNLSASNSTESTVLLRWTAPGDDGATGTATSYDVRYSTAPILEANWANATPASGEPIPGTAGSAQSMVVAGLNSGTTYFFAVKAVDDAGNESAVSNSPSATTTANQASVLVLDTSLARLTNGDRRWNGWVLRNTSTRSIEIDQITIGWQGGGSEYDRIEIDDDRVFDDRVANGFTADIDDVEIDSLGAVFDNEIRFRSSMSGATLSITFLMSDGSSVSFTGISL